MEKSRHYKERLESYNLSERTRELYLSYHKRLFSIIGELEVTQEIADAFLKDYPNSVCMAFLNDYSKWKKLSLELENRIVKRKPEKAKHYILESEVKEIGDWLFKKYGIRYFLILNLTYHCALRRKEAVGFNIQTMSRDFKEWKENDDPNKQLRLTVVKESAKRNKERKVIVPPKLASLLYNYVKDNKDKMLETNHPNNIFMLGVDRWHKVFKQAVKGALNQDYTLHELRFSRATHWFLKKGFNIVTIQKLLGHTDITTTQRYIDPAQESALRELESVYN